LWWHGSCEGCRRTPLSPNLPDHNWRSRPKRKDHI
jgi:hypothetical protein